MERDGYYITTSICLSVGVIFLVAYIIPTAKRLQGLFARGMYASTTKLLTCMRSHSSPFNKVAGCYLKPEDQTTPQ